MCACVCVCVSLQHEQASLDMLDHLLEVNKLKLEDYKLFLPMDLIFIKELIDGPKPKDPQDPDAEVCTLTLPTEGLVQ